MSYDTHWDQFSKFYPKTPNKKQILSDWIKKKKRPDLLPPMGNDLNYLRT